MKLKKGSKEARDFMAKIRAKKKIIKKIGTIKEDKVYITFLNKSKGFKPDIKNFNSYQEALNWGKKNFEKFDSDMIKYKAISGVKKTIKKSAPKKAVKKTVKKVATKKAVKRIAGEKHTDIKSHNYKINISGVDFFEKNILEYNKYNHLTIIRNYRGRDSAKLNKKVIALKKAYNLIDKGGYEFYNQINLGWSLLVDYRKLK